MTTAVAERTITYVDPELRECDLPEYALLRIALYDVAMNSTHTSKLMKGEFLEATFERGRRTGLR